jgi:hypothetical protein
MPARASRDEKVHAEQRVEGSRLVRREKAVKVQEKATQLRPSVIRGNGARSNDLAPFHLAGK